ncbi:MAG: CocE/NonD family hydrolase [Myxococcota bacterium]
MIRGLLRRLWQLPEQRCRSQIEPGWASMRDGVRLATWHVWPIDLRGEAPTIVMRTPYGVHGGRSPVGMAARLMAESGFHVVVQDVRGRYESEGQFTPFINERADGADTLDWLVRQHWHRGPIGLFGASYLAYSAWCALSEAPERVGAMVSAIGSGRMYPVFHRAGAFELQNAFEWGLGVGEREGIPARRIDLERGLGHRPLREADRVALRKVQWLRDWIDHEREDEYWLAIHPPIPTTLPPSLLIAGWYDFFLATQLADFDSLTELAREKGSTPPRLIIGPWAHGLPAKMEWWRHEMAGFVLREAIQHFDRNLREQEPTVDTEAVRYFSAGSGRWQSSPTWPPPGVETRSLYLRSKTSTGVLQWDPSIDEEEALRFDNDPEEPNSAPGGALLGTKAGIKDQSRVDPSGRHCLCYDSEPLETELALAGPIRLEIWFSTDSEDADVTARLSDVFPSGRVENVCDGIQRCRWREVAANQDQPNFLSPGEMTKLSIDLDHTARTISTGHSLRLEIAGSNFPRYDRNPGTSDIPGLAEPERFRGCEHRIHHGPEAMSRLILSVEAETAGASSPGRQARGPAEEARVPPGRAQAGSY